jgi:hypothetical protein
MLFSYLNGWEYGHGQWLALWTHEGCFIYRVLPSIAPPSHPPLYVMLPPHFSCYDTITDTITDTINDNIHTHPVSTHASTSRHMTIHDNK